MNSRLAFRFLIRTLTTLVLLQLVCFAGHAVAQHNYSLHSPDQKIEVRIRTGDRFKYDVLLNGNLLMQDSALSITIDQTTLGLQPKVKDKTEHTVNQEIIPSVPQKSARIRENYNELRLDMEGNYRIVFRAYNEGIAYRVETSLPQREIKVQSEEVRLNFAGDYKVYYPKEETFFSHNEREFLYLSLKDIPPTVPGEPAGGSS